ncbi:inositol-pentakisphosphate 2-kinase [Ranunculus cassubicifolius]
MGRILEEKDAAEWVYRGEGAANLVLSYTGRSPTYIGKVLRIKKSLRSKPQSITPASVLSPHDILLWKDLKDIVSSTSTDTAAQLYVLNVMLPLLGSDHVDAGKSILVSRPFLEAIEKTILSQRPSWRVDAAKVNTVCDSALLISDHSIFPHGVLQGDPCISVELKPKCGFLPSSKLINEQTHVKKSVPRFRMHQYLKLRQGEISQLSEYNPLDLFSGCREKTNKALNALYRNPQNNFRVFMNGSFINFKGGESLESQLEGVISADDGERLPNFLNLISETILKSGVLNRLLEAQKLDSLDIEGAIHAYYNIVSQPCKVCRDLKKSEFSQRCESLHSLSLEESLKIVRDYLISATAKDCSLMISFKPGVSGDLECSFGSVQLESTKQRFEYKAYFIDLDMKPLKKMGHYYELDQRIVKCFMEMQNGQNGLSTNGRC